MDPFYAWVLGVGAAFVVVGVVLGRREDRKLRKLFRRLAAEAGGRIRRRRLTYAELHVPHAGRTIVLGGLPPGTSSGGGSAGGSSESYATVRLPGAPSFVLSVRPRGLGTTIDEWTGLGVVEGGRTAAVSAGSPEFRARFLVQSDDLQRAAQVLGRELQEMLLALDVREPGPGRTRLLYRRSRIYDERPSGKMFAVRKAEPADYEPLLTVASAPFAVDAALYRQLLRVARTFVDAVDAVR